MTTPPRSVLELKSSPRKIQERAGTIKKAKAANGYATLNSSPLKTITHAKVATPYMQIAKISAGFKIIESIKPF